MYTECPECRSAFRLTVTVLRQAHGRVRCGGCGHVFDALDYLQDDAGGSNPGSIEETSAGVRFERQSRALLKSLDELTGPDDVRIEDTGIEWRVIDLDENEDEDAAVEAADDTSDDTGALRWFIDQAPEDAGVTQADEPAVAGVAEGAPEDADSAEGTAEADDPERNRSADDALSLEEDTRNFHLDDASQETADISADDAPAALVDADAQVVLELGTNADEMRYDDNTPLPDDEVGAAPTPRRRAEDFLPPPVSSELQDDLALGDPDDWRALLEEVDDGSARRATADSRSIEPDDGELSIADEDDPVPSTDDATPPGTTAADDQSAAESVAAPIGANADSGVSGGEQGAARESADDDVERSGRLQMREELLRALAREESNATGDDDRPSDDVDHGLVETIVMEGETVRSALDDEDIAAPAERFEINIPPPVEERDAPPPRPYWHGLAAVAALGLLLSAQLVHANRESLARIGAVHATLAPLYRLFGDPLIPAWNVRGWQFESTTGNTNADGTRLTIYSRIANRTDDALPYPLVHLSLTDRFEDVVGSRVLLPDEYLAGPGDTARAVPPGDTFTAVIAIDAPADEATGFKLNVCYRLAAERLRCAIDDFRN